MKRLKYFPLFILLSISAYSQNIIDPPVLPIGFDSTALFDRTFNDTTFIRAWNWGSPGRALDEALRINFYHDGYEPGVTTQAQYTGDTLTADSLLYIPNHRKAVQVTGVSGGRDSKFILNAHSQIIYPVIEVDSTSDFVPRAFDRTGSVFGFTNKSKVRILNSSQNTSKDYHFALLDKDSVTSPEIVLSNIWKNNKFTSSSIIFMKMTKKEVNENIRSIQFIS
ncbi:MAG: hypothetical protein RO257_08545 [Candidatus Kapabacteria bacterium]|jgi:hypothetical protein|nr:hypothetical protein [Candidatus Kapabacteria bacterium]